VTRTQLERGPVVVFAPHPDDEVLGCGLTCHRHHLAGDTVHVVIAYDGALGNRGSEAQARAAFVARREDEARAACALLGFQPPIFLRAPEGHEPGPAEFEAAVAGLEGLLRRLRPATVYAPWEGEHQLDHHVLARAVRAARARLDAPRPILWQYEIWSALVPTHVVDVGDLWHLKEEALGLHRSQLEHTDLLHHIGGLNAHRALYVAGGARRAEAFARVD
jgi:LmbE family N-acetylglucosaminyl deacetylase